MQTQKQQEQHCHARNALRNKVLKMERENLEIVARKK
jgi:hypothetical protein